MTVITPRVGSWYQDAVDGHLFEVVAIDEQTATIETQHFDGAVEEYDFETWRAMRVLEAAEPEDWSGPYEVDGHDHHEIDGDLALSDWSDPLLKIEPHGLMEAIDAMDDGAL